MTLQVVCVALETAVLREVNLRDLRVSMRWARATRYGEPLFRRNHTAQTTPAAAIHASPVSATRRTSRRHRADDREQLEHGEHDRGGIDPAGPRSVPATRRRSSGSASPVSAKNAASTTTTPVVSRSVRSRPSPSVSAVDSTPSRRIAATGVAKREWSRANGAKNWPSRAIAQVSRGPVRNCALSTPNAETRDRRGRDPAPEPGRRDREGVGGERLRRRARRRSRAGRGTPSSPTGRPTITIADADQDRARHDARAPRRPPPPSTAPAASRRRRTA